MRREVRSSSRQQATPARRLLPALLALVLALTSAFAFAPRPAYAAEPDPPVSLHVDSFAPELPSRTDTITIRATARNDTDEPITQAQAVFWRHRPALRTLADLRDTVGRAPRDVQGFQYWVEGAYQALTTNQDPEWLPGELRTFELRAPISDLSLNASSGVFLVGAQVVGRPNGGSLSTLGQTRLLLPLGTGPPAATTGTNPVISTVLLSSRPGMLEPGVFVDDHVAGELGPTGRLTILLAAAGRPEVSWLIDPALIEELHSMAAGYRVRIGDTEVAGGGQQAAAAWLARFAELDRTRGYRVPFALPDASMLHRAALSDVVNRAAAAGDRVPDVADLPLLGHTAEGVLDPDALALEEVGDPVGILTSSPTVSPALLEPLGTAPLINYTPASTAGGPGPEPSTSSAHVRQRMLAESYLVALSDPGAATVRVITTSAAATADEQPDPAWVTRRTLGSLLTDAPVAWPGELAYSDAQRQNELTEPRVRVLRDIVTDYRAFTEMLVDPEPTSRAADAALARSASSWWRADQTGFDAYAAPQALAAERLWSGQSITLAAQPSVLMSGQSGSFPMTVTNRLNVEVRVRLTFESFQPQRLSIPDMDLVVGPEQSVTVTVQPHAVGNGPVRISAWVTAPDGTQVSKRVWMTVEATNFGRVGWIIVIASGIVLLATTALRIRQVRRERRRAAADAPAPSIDHHPPPVVKTGDQR